MRRVNESLETYKNLTASRSQLAQKEADAINEKVAENERFKDQYHSIMDKRNRLESTRSVRMEAARNDALGTVMKAIYITALEAHTLTDDGILLAESMVDNWIVENGGASRILSKVGNKTYLLSRITQIVENAATAAVAETEALESDTELPEDAKKTAAVAAAKEFLKDADAEGIKDFMSQILSGNAHKDPVGEPGPEGVNPADEDEEELKLPATEEPKTEDETPAEEKPVEEEPKTSEETDANPTPAKEEEETSSENKDNEVVVDDEDDDSDPLATTFEDDPEDDDDEEHHEEDTDGDGEVSKDEIEDHTEDELGEPLDDDSVDQDTTMDGNTENDDKIFEELDKEEDVQKAIEIIRSRIADAEETFIRNNAEDKKKIDELLNKISTNVKTVEDLADKDETKAKIAEESVRTYKRHIDSIKENRPMTVFEKMSRNISKSIIKDEVVRESYITESGTLDTDLIVESAKVMYGFLETINTLQFDKVDSAYIKKVLDGMNK